MLEKFSRNLRKGGCDLSEEVTFIWQYFSDKKFSNFQYIKNLSKNTVCHEFQSIIKANKLSK